MNTLFQLAKYEKFDHGEMTIMEAMDHMHNFIDETDPDVSIRLKFRIRLHKVGVKD